MAGAWAGGLGLWAEGCPAPSAVRCGRGRARPPSVGEDGTRVGAAACDGQHSLEQPLAHRGSGGLWGGAGLDVALAHTLRGRWIPVLENPFLPRIKVGGLLTRNRYFTRPFPVQNQGNPAMTLARDLTVWGPRTERVQRAASHPSSLACPPDK